MLQKKKKSIFKKFKDELKIIKGEIRLSKLRKFSYFSIKSIKVA